MLSLLRPLLVMTALLCLLAGAAPARGNDPDSLNKYAVELINRGEYDKALELLQRAYSLNAYDPNLRSNLAEAYAYVGRKHLEANRYDDAATFFDNARELFPDSSRYGALRGISLYFAKRYDAALFELERATANGGETVENLYFLGKARYDSDNLAGALAAWEKALTIEPGNAPIRQLVEKAKRESAVESRMEKGYSSRFTITYDTGVKSQLADSVLDTLEGAYNSVGADLQHFPEAKITVILYTQKDYRTVTASPDWSGGLYDGKIRLPIGGATELGELLKSVLVHEYTHVVVRELTNGNCPTWLNEGLAEMQGRKVHNSPLGELPRTFRSGTIPPLSSLEGSLGALGGKEAHLAYEESYSVANFLIAVYGWHKVREILVNLGTGMPVAAAMAKALGDYGLDYTQVEKEWRDSLQKELGR